MSDVNDLTDAQVSGQLTFGQKMSYAFHLFKKHGLLMFGLLMLAGLMWALLSVVLALLLGPMTPMGTSWESKRLIVIALPMVVAICVLAPCLIGMFALALRYVDGERPKSVWRVVLSPWSRLGRLFLAGFSWLVILFLFGLFLYALSQIPWLGLVFYFVGLLFVHMIFSCAFCYMADRGGWKVADAVSEPFKIVFGSLRAWLATGVVLFLLSLPPLALTSLGLAARLGGQSDFNWQSALGWIFYMAWMIYSWFLWAVTYRQVRGGFGGENNLAQVF